MTNDREKTAYLTLLSVISSIAVVILHANGCFWRFSTERYWITANILECVCYFAVPVFFMITGATLLDFRDRYDTKAFIKKRVAKTLIPFLFWSVFGVFFLLFVTKSLTFEELSVFSVIDGILNTRYVDIYWFFRVLFVIYAAIALLSFVPKEKRTSAFGWAALICVCTCSLIPFCLDASQSGVHWPLGFGEPLSYLQYLFIGYYLSRKELSRPWRLLIYALSIVGLASHLLGTYYLSRQLGEIAYTYKGYVNLPCVLYSAGVFLFFKEHGNGIMKAFPGKIVRAIAPHTFSIYLLHFFLLRLIQKAAAHFGLFIDLSLWYRLGAVVLIVPAVMMIDWIVRKIPVLKYTLPS